MTSQLSDALDSSADSEAVSPSEAIWTLLDQPFRPVEATRSMFGLSAAAARHVVGRELLISDEAGALLDAAPDIVRYMTNRLNFNNVRSVGAVVGPIQWHETIMARAAAGFPEDLFVCAAPYRDFNMPENQLLLHSLKQLVDAGRHMTAFARDSFDDERVALGRSRARQASSLMELRSFAGVTAKRSPQTIRATQRSAAKGTYESVLEFVPRSRRPLSAWAITHLGDRRTSLQHKVFLAIMATLRREGVDVRPFRPEDGVLRAGPVEYRHPGARGIAGAHGIRVGHLLIDVPDIVGDHEGSLRRLGQRSGMLTPLLVESIAEVADLKDRLITATESSERSV